jgi:hypothetical protein
MPGSRPVSSVFVMCLPDEVVVYADCAIKPEPDAEELADIAFQGAASSGGLLRTDHGDTVGQASRQLLAPETCEPAAPLRAWRAAGPFTPSDAYQCLCARRRT